MPNGHERHRHGTEADLGGWSVPPKPYLICGLPPTDTYDERWKSILNPLWNRWNNFGGKCNFTYFIQILKDGTKKPDYGHICLKKEKNICF